MTKSATWILGLATLSALSGCGSQGSPAGGTASMPSAMTDPITFADDPAGAEMIGKAAPELEASLRSGDKLTLASFKGKVVVLNFWATWCAPCVQELPALERLRRQLEGTDVQVVGVSVDESWEKVDGIVKKMPLEYTLALDPTSASAKRFGTEKFPETYILDKEGKVVKKYIGMQIWDRGDFVVLLKQLAATSS